MRLVLGMNNAMIRVRQSHGHNFVYKKDPSDWKPLNRPVTPPSSDTQTTFVKKHKLKLRLPPRKREIPEVFGPNAKSAPS